MKDVTCTKCGSINDYEIRKSELHQTAFCNCCGAYIKHLPREGKDHVIYFGKYKGTLLKDFTTKDHVNWLNWCLNSVETLKPALREAILKHLNNAG